MPSRFIIAPPTSTQMDHSKKILFPRWTLKVLLIVLALFVRVEKASSANDRFCFSDCDTCPLICSPPPLTPLITISASYPPPSSPSTPHSYATFSPPPSPPKSHSPPLPSPPLKPNYNTPLSGSTTEAQPTVVSGPHDYYYPYYYFYSSCASSLSNHDAPFFVLLLFLVGYLSLVGK